MPPRPEPIPDPCPSAETHAPAIPESLDQRILALDAQKIGTKRIANTLHTTEWNVRTRLKQLRGTPQRDVRPHPEPAGPTESPPPRAPGPEAQAPQNDFDRRLLALAQEGLGHRRIHQACLPDFPEATRHKVYTRLRALGAPHGRPRHSGTPAPRPPAPPTLAARARDLRSTGLSYRQIGRTLGISRERAAKYVKTHPERWNTPGKRQHETRFLALARQHLSGAGGWALALTSTQLDAHAQALAGAVDTLVAVERDPQVFDQMFAALPRTPPLPIVLHLGEFWDAADQLPGPITFVNYDGMARLPPDIQSRLERLSLRLGARAAIRLTFSLSHGEGPQDRLRGLQVLRTLPGLTLTQLWADLSGESQMMATLLALYTRPPRGAPA